MPTNSRCLRLLMVPMLLVALGCTFVPSTKALAADGPFVYPKARKGDQVDDYHGTKVPDPYRWLEDPDSAESRAWIEAEGRITYPYIRSIPERDKIKSRLTKLWNYERFGQPFHKGGRYFFQKNDGLQDQYVLYTTDSLNGTPRMLLDPNTLSKDGTVALGGVAVSHDGKYLAYALARQGSDWREWKVRDVKTGRDLDDHLKWVKFSGASWTTDGKGFFYSRYDAPDETKKLRSANYYQKLYYHRLGTPQSNDLLVYHRPDKKDWGFGGSVTDDGRYLIINVSKGTLRKNMVFYKDLQAASGSLENRIKNAPVVELVNQFEASYNFVDNDGSTFWFSTDLDAPRSRVVAIDTNHPERNHWRTLIPESKDTLRGVSMVGDTFFASYLSDAKSKVRLYQPNGTFVRELPLPGLGSAGGFGGQRSDTETFYSYTSFTDPGTIFRYDIKSSTSSVFRKPKVDFDENDYTTEQIFYHSKDGTRVPMFLSHKKGISLNGANPTLLYGYGGFDIPITPRFSLTRLVWMEMGGIYAVANLRGGGEYGTAWHEAGMKLNKQNVFDDFIAAGEWLIKNKYTRTDKLAILGGSNGGLLVGACITQRPELFGAAIPAVGVLDMLRFHKFTIGWAWTSDYGSSENPEEFKALYAYSPYHNLKPGVAYPATMITTADHDDRVVPAHSFKFAARLQEMHSGSAPVLIRIQTNAGHGAGKPTSMQIDEAADMWSFLVKNLDMDLSHF